MVEILNSMLPIIPPQNSILFIPFNVKKIEMLLAKIQEGLVKFCLLF